MVKKGSLPDKHQWNYYCKNCRPIALIATIKANKRDPQQPLKFNLPIIDFAIFGEETKAHKYAVISASFPIHLTRANIGQLVRSWGRKITARFCIVFQFPLHGSTKYFAPCTWSSAFGPLKGKASRIWQIV